MQPPAGQLWLAPARLLAHRQLVQCAGCRFSTVSITATASHPSTVLSRNEISAPDSRRNTDEFRTALSARPASDETA
jgi:hypothetical protein